jgi:uncharacterized protein (TIGR01619 family)
LGWKKNIVNRENVEKVKDEWDFYFSNVNDVRSSLMVNLSAIRRAPDGAKPWLLWVWVHMLDARDDGLSSENEAPMLFQIEDRLGECLTAACGAELLGRITGDRRREFYYYAATADGFDSAVETAMVDYTGYRVDRGKQPDPEWRQYKDVLYPLPTQLQQIHNRRVLDQLLERGDDHSFARIVDHAIYFGSASERATFASATIKLGFGIQHESQDVQSAERPFFLKLTRSDPVTLDHINAIVAELIELAEKFGGDYDGWGCEVQKTPAA